MKATSLPSAVLVALLLGPASSPGPGPSGREVRSALAGQGAPREEPDSVQELLRIAWVRSRPTDAQKSQAAIIREWLAPLTGMVVSIRVDAQGFGRFQLTDTLIRQTVERRLRRDGIEVLDQYAAAGSGAGRHSLLTVATLSVETLGIVRSDGNVAAMCLLLKPQQEVAQVAANTPTFARADTWQRAAFALVTPRDIRTCCLKNLEDLVAHFAKDWLSAHGDPPEGQQTQKRP
jgi:hypothetical protein